MQVRLKRSQGIQQAVIGNRRVIKSTPTRKLCQASYMLHWGFCSVRRTPVPHVTDGIHHAWSSASRLAQRCMMWTAPASYSPRLRHAFKTDEDRSLTYAKLMLTELSKYGLQITVEPYHFPSRFTSVSW